MNLNTFLDMQMKSHINYIVYNHAHGHKNTYIEIIKFKSAIISKTYTNNIY